MRDLKRVTKRKYDAELKAILLKGRRDKLEQEALLELEAMDIIVLSAEHPERDLGDEKRLLWRAWGVSWRVVRVSCRPSK